MRMRPMSEVPEDGTRILAVSSHLRDDGTEARYLDFCGWDGSQWVCDDACVLTDLIGWYELPDYEHDQPIIE